MTSPTLQAEPAVRIRNLVKDFHVGLRGMKLRAVDDLSLAVPAGCVYGLLGPNGSGKSTTLKILLGLMQPTRGSVEVFGKASGEAETRALTGFLPEAPYFYKYLSGREFVAYCAELCGVPRKARKERVSEVLRLVGLEEAADRRVGTYSKGMLQRVGLAQAVVHDPTLVVLDEPTAGVDPIGSAEMGNLILELKKQGKTVILCSHLLAQVEGLCDRVAILHRGHLVAEGAVDELLREQEARLLRVAGLRDADLPALRAFLESRGARLEQAGDARVSLDAFFLSQVTPEKATKEGTR